MRLYCALNLLHREIPNASVKMTIVQQKARLPRLLFHKSKSIVTFQRSFGLEYRNCQSPSKNPIMRWHEQFKGTDQRKGAGRPAVSDEVAELVRETFTP
ncbi:hypothetical protein AVEN_214850-1 [Araneus ventricosus]|uniref:DUF4817 domain-containing protein n=1 Tax=Araneus ventricosus TaxID=182803 RepID=A0A4Y2T1D8_ARAVE|nr:hypothetical protein AVEN_16483-1 [Araneus ventricosus]GBN94422.1 hypothetical protein AVEN_145442-1 [Araneus ventricosus]GBN94425.1 hypothetical protein AVEN_158001-1 [Araneus ventricosus]GBN94428.1 hypothetical protein AVEN_214850-1 [Araneus ventricosus]